MLAGSPGRVGRYPSSISADRRAGNRGPVGDTARISPSPGGAMRSLPLAPTLLSVSADPQPGKDEGADRFARWEKEVSAIEKRLADDPPKPGCVVFAGSSSIRLWDLKKSFP